jgi:tyrosine-protein kinase Etk/Wzc
LVVAGHTLPNPGDFISSPGLAAVFKKFRSAYDVVLVDTPPMLAAGDALALSAHLDAFLLVSNLTLARRGELRELRRMLSFASCEVLGVVLTASQPTEANMDGGFYYGYREASPTAARVRPDSAPAQR